MPAEADANAAAAADAYAAAAAEEAAEQSPAIRKLGSLFRITEVHLWEDSNVVTFSENYKQRNSSEVDHTRSHSNKVSNATAEQMDEVGYALVEDLELANLMDALGLPVSFGTTKEKKNTINRGKKKEMRTVSEPAKAMDIRSNADGRGISPSTVCDEQTIIPSSRKAAVGYADFVASEVEEVLGESNLCVKEEESHHCSVWCTESALDEAVEDSCETNTGDDDLQRNKEHLQNSFLGNGSKSSCSEIYKEGKLSRKEDETFLDNRSMTHDAADMDREPCKSSVESSLSDQSVQNSYCNVHYEHGDWRVVWDTFYNQYYFYNIQTQESTWYPPPDLEDFAFSGSKEDEEGSHDTSCILQESSTNCVNFDQSTEGVSVCADNATDFSMLEADEPIEQVLVQHLTTCVNEKESSDEAGISGHLDRQGQDLLFNQLGGAQYISHEDPINESLVTTINEALSDENMQKKSSTTDVLDMDWEVARTKKKKRVRRSQSHHTCQDMVESISNDIAKYWSQRYVLFSRFSYGIKMDAEGWFSVTPEPIAKHHASRVGTGILIECFAGVGGNTIQFATKCNHVVAVDIDPQKIDYAQHNAAIYGVNHRIDFIVGDVIQIGPRLKGETAFMSPPWGGPDYAKVEIYDIKTMLKPCDGYALFKLATMIASRVVMFLPRNVDLNQLAELSLCMDPPWAVEVEKNFLNGKLKAITAYFEEHGCSGARQQ